MKYDYKPKIIDYIQTLYVKASKFNLKTKYVYKKIIEQLKKEPEAIFEMTDLNVKFLGQKTKQLIQENVFNEKDINDTKNETNTSEIKNTKNNDASIKMKNNAKITENSNNSKNDSSCISDKKDIEQNTDKIESLRQDDCLENVGNQILKKLKIEKEFHKYNVKKDTDSIIKDCVTIHENNNEETQTLSNKNKICTFDESKKLNITNAKKISIDVKNKSDNKTNTKNKRNNKKYIPKYMSGAFAILKSLSKCDGLSKRQICIKSNKYSKIEFNPMERFSAWNSIKTLIKKNLVFVEDKKYYLTNLGIETCNQLNFMNKDNNESKANRKAETEIKCAIGNSNDVRMKLNECNNKNDENENQVMNTSTIKNNDSLTINTTDITTKNESEIQLIIDSREIKNKRDRLYFQRNLNGDTKNLELGDFLWIKNDNVLNYIIERKKGADFVSSIIDGRFNEQKKRLSESGVKNIFYIVEDLKEKDCKNVNYNFVKSCLSTTKNEDFFVLETTDIKETVEVIKIIDTFVRKDDKKNSFDKYQLNHDDRQITNDDKRIKTQKDADFAMSYDDFAEKGRKTNNVTNTNILYRMLLSVNGLSHKKAEFLADEYKTIYNFMKEVKKDDFIAKISQIEIDGSKFGKRLAYKIVDMIN